MRFRLGLNSYVKHLSMVKNAQALKGVVDVYKNLSQKLIGEL